MFLTAQREYEEAFVERACRCSRNSRSRTFSGSMWQAARTSVTRSSPVGSSRASSAEQGCRPPRAVGHRHQARTQSCPGVQVEGVGDVLQWGAEW